MKEFYFSSPIHTTHIKILPEKFTGELSLRAALLYDKSQSINFDHTLLTKAGTEHEYQIGVNWSPKLPAGFNQPTLGGVD